MSTIAVVPTPWARLEDALHARRPIHVTYHGLTRLICPHALGRRAGRPMVLGYQTGGESSTGTLNPDPTKRWRCLYIDEITDLTPADPTSPWHTANNYNPTNPIPIANEITVAVQPHAASRPA